MKSTGCGGTIVGQLVLQRHHRHDDRNVGERPGVEGAVEAALLVGHVRLLAPEIPGDQYRRPDQQRQHQPRRPPGPIPLHHLQGQEGKAHPDAEDAQAQRVLLAQRQRQRDGDTQRRQGQGKVRQAGRSTGRCGRRPDGGTALARDGRAGGGHQADLLLIEADLPTPLAPHPSTTLQQSSGQSSGHRVPLSFTLDAETCTQCRRCVTICAYNARRLTPEGEMLLDETLCRSCGLCASVCPTGALRSQRD